MPWVTKHSGEQYPPEPPQPYTRRQRWRDWWYYYKWLVLVAVLAVLAVGIAAHEIATQLRPDLCVGYVAPDELPLDTVPRLEEALAALCPDANGDGQVVVEVRQYLLDFNGRRDPLDNFSQLFGIRRLTGDVEKGDPAIFLLADPEGFAANTGAAALQPPRLWSGCPALTALALGTYTAYTPEGEPFTGESQALLAPLAVVRYAPQKQADAAAAATDALWQAMTAGAAR